MAATTARSLMSPLQFKEKNPYQTPITIAVNLPKRHLRRRICHHACSNSGSLTLSSKLNYGAIEGSRLPVAYQGVQGAYSESAAEKAYSNCKAVPYEHFENCFQAVESGLVDRAVLPIENSLGGSIHRNYDLLLRHNLHIVGEVNLPIRHCLLANPSAKVEDLKRVLSHQQALSQCENSLTKLGLVREAMYDTAGAAKYVAVHKLKDVGAVASMAAAKIYGLNILAQDIQDDPDNITRFLMLAREPIIPSTNKPFKIESRPLHKQASRTLADNTIGLRKYFNYIFYVDFEASTAENRTQNALDHLKVLAKVLKVLGSYPADNSIQ